MANGKIRILFLASNPMDTPPLRLDQELKKIKQSLREGTLRDEFDVHTAGAVSEDDLSLLLLQSEPTIVHFSGHGADSGAIKLQNEAGYTEEVAPERLADLFRILRGRVQGVVMNACWSQTQAEALVETAGIRWIVGMEREIEDPAAIKFSAGFYQALAFGQPIGTAFALGVHKLGSNNFDERGTPHLLVARGVDASKEDVIPEAHPYGRKAMVQSVPTFVQYLLTILEEDAGTEKGGHSLEETIRWIEWFNEIDKFVQLARNCDRFDEIPLEELYRKSVPPNWKLSRRIGGTPSDRLGQVLEDLAHAGLIDQHSPLLQFLGELLPFLDDPLRTSLTKWGGIYAKLKGISVHWGAEHQPLKYTREARISYLTVKVEPSITAPGRYQLKAWFHQVAPRPLQVDGTRFTRDQLPDVIFHLLDEIDYDEFAAAGDALIVEVFLPYTLLDLDIEHCGNSLPDQLPLGVTFPVVTRLLERYDPRYKKYSGAWRERWKEQQQLDEINCRISHLWSEEEIGSPFSWQSLWKYLKKDKAVVLVLGFAPTERERDQFQQDVMLALIQAATPIMLWQRRPPDDPNSIKTAVSALLSSVPLSQLPFSLRARREHTFGTPALTSEENLTLLWDDPNRDLPDRTRRYTTPPVKE